MDYIQFHPHNNGGIRLKLFLSIYWILIKLQVWLPKQEEKTLEINNLFFHH